MGCGVLARDALEQLDAQLEGVAREEAGLRLRLGQVLEVMNRRAYHFELGFSSRTAYALERCERNARWVEVACCLARRLEALPLLRSAVVLGRVSWSTAELLARVALPEEEARWLELARRHTLRELRREVRAREAVDGDAPPSVALADEHAAMCTLAWTLHREDFWLFEATRALLEALGTRGAEEQLEALLAEGQGALLAALPTDAMDLEGFEGAGEVQQRWREQLARWRAEAEERCEPRIRDRVLERGVAMSGGIAGQSIAGQAALGCGSLEGYTSRELDAVVRQLAATLAGHDLRLSRLLWRFHRADGWRRLGYATEAQYARERLGMSRSSVLARRALARRLEALPAIAAALQRSEIGVEAALQVVRIATPRTERAWLERARQRTVKHLREEVAAALTAVRLSNDADCPPPDEQELDGFQELERAVLSGQVWGGTPNRPQPGCTPDVAAMSPAGSRVSPSRRPWSEMLSSLRAWLEQGALEHAVQMSAAGPASRQARSAGRVEVRLHVSPATRSWWQALEARARPWLPRSMSWVKFLCLAFWSAWRHVLGVSVAYGQVYLRDRCRCSSPVCNRADVTPHHIQFRSAGGSDEDGNIASLCTWCHLFGVHGGRIRATGSAGQIRWELGPREAPCVRVKGRQRLAAA